MLHSTDVAPREIESRELKTDFGEQVCTSKVGRRLQIIGDAKSNIRNNRHFRGISTAPRYLVDEVLGYTVALLDIPHTTIISIVYMCWYIHFLLYRAALMTKEGMTL